MAISRRIFLTISAGGTIGAIALHAGLQAPVAQAQAKVVNLYSARHYEADTQVYEGFFKKTGIKVNLVEAPADKLIERLKSEGKNSPADVVLTVDAGNLHRAKQEGLFQAIDSKVLKERIPGNLRDNDNQWFGFTKRARVILYNKDKAPDLSKVKSYEDLGRSDLGLKILVRSSGNIYNQSLMASIIEHRGAKAAEDWARGLKGNLARDPQGNDTAQIKALSEGAGDLALVNSYYLVRLMKSSKPEDKAIADKIKVIFPNQLGDGKDGRGTHVNISGGGVAKFAPNKDAAVQFLEFLASDEAQKIFAGSNNEYPAVAGVDWDPTLKGLGSFKEDSLEARILGERNKEATQLMDKAGWK